VSGGRRCEGVCVRSVCAASPHEVSSAAAGSHLQELRQKLRNKNTQVFSLRL